MQKVPLKQTMVALTGHTRHGREDMAEDIKHYYVSILVI